LEYRDNVAADNIQLPRTRLNYSLHTIDAPGSAPMLQGINWPFSFNFLNLVGWSPNPFNNDPSVLPDITNAYQDNDTADSFNDTGFHELGHASHYGKVGESYWIPFRAHVVNNGGDGTFPNFNGNNAEFVALGEAVAEYIEEIYGPISGGDNNEWRGNFIPAGMLLDLEDPIDNAEIIADFNDPTINILDVTEGFTREMLFNPLTSDVRSIRQYRDRLRTLHLQDTPNNINDFNNLIDVYDVFN